MRDTRPREASTEAASKAKKKRRRLLFLAWQLVLHPAKGEVAASNVPVAVRAQGRATLQSSAALVDGPWLSYLVAVGLMRSRVGDDPISRVLAGACSVHRRDLVQSKSGRGLPTRTSPARHVYVYFVISARGEERIK